MLCPHWDSFGLIVHGHQVERMCITMAATYFRALPPLPSDYEYWHVHSTMIPGHLLVAFSGSDSCHALRVLSEVLLLYVVCYT